VNICCLILRRDPQPHKHFVAPTVIPVIAALCCGYMVGPWTGRDVEQYQIAGVLLAIGVVLWLITWLINRAVYKRPTQVRDAEHLDTDGPVN
jgi:predicted exporter